VSNVHSLDRGPHAPVPGAGRLTAELPGRALTVFTYTPGSEPRGCLILFSGQRRDAPGLRDKAIGLARVSALTVFVPLMDEDDFPVWRYNRAGIIRRRRVQPRDTWTGPLLQGLVDWARDRMGGGSLPTFVFGHSAGAQLLSRVCAYSPLTGVNRFIICSPSVHVAPTAAKPVPYGFRGLFDARDLEERMRGYLAAPITIFLGKQDTGNRQLSNSKQSMSQGINRLDRGRRIFEMATMLAERRKWILNWRLVEAPGVGHAVKGMLDAPECLDVLQFAPEQPGQTRHPQEETSLCPFESHPT
jgi:hypothetical protein